MMPSTREYIFAVLVNEPTPWIWKFCAARIGGKATFGERIDAAAGAARCRRSRRSVCRRRPFQGRMTSFFFFFFQQSVPLYRCAACYSGAPLVYAKLCPATRHHFFVLYRYCSIHGLSVKDIGVPGADADAGLFGVTAVHHLHTPRCGVHPVLLGAGACGVAIIARPRDWVVIFFVVCDRIYLIYLCVIKRRQEPAHKARRLRHTRITHELFSIINNSIWLVCAPA